MRDEHGGCCSWRLGRGGSEAVEIAANGMRSTERKDGKKIYMCDGGETQLKNVTYGGAKRVPIA